MIQYHHPIDVVSVNKSRFRAAVTLDVQASVGTDALRADRTISATSPLSGGGDLTANRTLSVGGLSSMGTGNYVVGVNSAGTGWEYKNILGTSNQISVAHAAGSLTLSTPQNIHTNATPTFAGMTLGGRLNFSSGDITNAVIPMGNGTATWIAGMFNLLNRAQVRSTYTVVQTGDVTFPNIGWMFDGSNYPDSLPGNISTFAVKPTIEVTWTGEVHSQNGGFGVGWSSRYWNPRNFVIELYLASVSGGPYAWTTAFSETAYSEGFYLKHYAGSYWIRGFRITINQSADTAGLQIGELFCLAREGLTAQGRFNSPYEDLYLNTMGGVMYGQTTFSGSILIPESAGSNKVLVSDSSGFAAWQALSSISGATGTGTNGTIAKWTGTSTVGNSSMTESSTELLTTLEIRSNRNQPWLTLHSNSGGAGTGVEQAAGISLGESGKMGAACLHFTYTGDGFGHIGMGTVTNTTSLMANRVIVFYYQDQIARFQGDVTTSTGSSVSLDSGTFYLRRAPGTSAAPSYTFSGDTDLGFYRVSADLLGFTANGSDRWMASTTALYGTSAGAALNGSFYINRDVGVAGFPTYSFGGDTNSGMYKISDGTIGFSSNGTERFRFDASGVKVTGAVTQSYSSGESGFRYHHNVLYYNNTTEINGAWIINSPIPRASSAMSSVRVRGYLFGNHGAGANAPSSLLDFTVSFYPYDGNVGDDGVFGSLVNVYLQDLGTDGLKKYIGVNSSGNVAIAIGDHTLAGAYYWRLWVDCATTRGTTDYSSGWSVVQSTTPGFGWIDAYQGTPAAMVALTPGTLVHYHDGSHIVSGTISSGRLTGGYTGVTQVGTLSTLAVSGAIMSGLNSAGGKNILITPDSIPKMQFRSATAPFAQILANSVDSALCFDASYFRFRSTLNTDGASDTIIDSSGIRPAGDEIIDIGSTSARVRKLYTSSLDATGDIYLGGNGTLLRSHQFRFEKEWSLVFSNGTANQKLDLYFSGHFWGLLEVEVGAGFSSQNAAGCLRKEFQVGLYYDGTSHNIYAQSTRYSEVGPRIAENFAISDVTWDSDNSRWKIQIVHRTSTGNSFILRARALAGSNTGLQIDQMSVSSVYTTDTTVFSAPGYSFDANLSGTTATFSALTTTGSVNAQTLAATDKSATRSNLGVLWADDTRRLVAGRKSVGGLRFDGTADYLVSGGNGIAISLGDFSIVGVLTLPDYTPSSAAILFASHHPGNNRFILRLETTGRFGLQFVDSSGSSTFYELIPDVPLVDGQTHQFCITCDRDGLATLYLNGMSDRDLSGSGVSVSISGSSAVDVGSGNSNPWGAGSLTVGVIHALAVFNRILSASEALMLTEQGTVSFADQWGSATPLISGATNNGNFETAGAGGADVFASWTETVSGTSTVVRDTTVFDTGSASCRLDIDASNSICGVSSNVGSAGRRYRVALRAKASANAVTLAVILGSTSQQTFSLTTSWSTYTAEIVSDAAGIVLKRLSAASESIWIDNVTLTPIGAILDLDFENANPAQSLTVRDRSANANHGTAAASGVTQITPVKQINITDSIICGGSIASSGAVSGSVLSSSVATGSAPLTVASTTLVSNLNADLLDGQHGAYYSDIPSRLGYTPLNRAPVISDWNAVTAGQGAFVCTSTNGPIGGTVVSGIYMPHISALYGVFLSGRQDNLYFRTEENGVRGAWRTLLHSGNFTTYTQTLAGVEGSNAETIWGGYLTNALTNWEARGGAITISATGGVTSINSVSYLVTPNIDSDINTLYRGLCYITRDNSAAGTAVIEFTGISFSVPAYTGYIPFLVARTSGYASAITNIKVEVKDNLNNWIAAFNGSPAWTDSCAWVGAEYSVANYPPKGVRFTLTLAQGSTNVYISECGLWSKNFITGSGLYAPLYKSASFLNLSSRSHTPVASASYDLGSSSSNWRNLYLSDALYFGAYAFKSVTARTDSNNYNEAARPTGIYAISGTGANGPGSAYLSLIHCANLTDVGLQIAGGYTSDNLYFRGTNALQLGSGWTAWRTVIHSGNYNTYAPTLNGGGAFGTWSINITGGASTASVLNGAVWSSPNNPSGNTLILFNNSTGSTGFPSEFGMGASFGRAPSGSSSANGSFILWSANGVSDSLYLSTYVDGSGWTTFRKFLHEGNYNSYSPALSGAGATGTWGISITGNAATASNTTQLNGQPASYYTNANNLSSGTIPSGRFPVLNGDVTTPGGSLATTISPGAVTLAKMSSLAANSMIGNNTASPATPLALTTTQVRALLSIGNVENTALSTWPGSSSITTVGTVTSGSISASLLTGTISAARMPALTGDVTSTSGSVATSIAANAVTLAKMQQVATSSILGRATASTGNIEVLTGSQAKAIIGLSNVENTALSSWAGSSNITTVGTLASLNVGTSATIATLCTAGGLRATGISSAGSGSGAEVQWDGLMSYFQSYNRSTGVFQPLVVAGSTINLKIGLTDALVVNASREIGIGASPASGRRLYINGDIRIDLTTFSGSSASKTFANIWARITVGGTDYWMPLYT